MSMRLPSVSVNAETSPELTPAWYADHVVADAERFATVLGSVGLDAPAPSCPGWSLARLTEHLGQIHRWARFCAANGRSPSDDEAAGLESFRREGVADWMRTGAAELAATLRTVDPSAPTWHPFPVDRVGAVWPRRMAHETAVHRWDAELAGGTTSPIDARLASDGIDEYFEVFVPRLAMRAGVELPPHSLHLHCTDVEGEWLVWTDDGAFRMIRAHEKGDAALRGPAEAILLRLWGRESPRAGELSPVGDASALDAWLALSGW
jgi:uncharacterized protein (TIGR03083 family)